MSWRQVTVTLPSKGKGCHLVTRDVLEALPELKRYKTGVLHLFIKHTSAGLSVQENWDADVRKDLSEGLDRLVPESGEYRHNAEGQDDAVSHIKAALVGSSVTVPIADGRLNVGQWQGIWLCEFRHAKQARQVVATIQGERMD